MKSSPENAPWFQITILVIAYPVQRMDSHGAK